MAKFIRRMVVGLGLFSLFLGSCVPSPSNTLPTQLATIEIDLSIETLEPTQDVTQTPAVTLTSQQPTATPETGLLFTYLLDSLNQAKYQNGDAQCVSKESGQWMFLYDVSPTGQWLLLGSFTQGKVALYMKSVDESVSSEIVAENVAGAAWIDEQQFLFWTVEGKIFWVDRSSNDPQPRLIVEGKNAAYCSVNESLAFIRQDAATGRKGLYVYDMAMQTERLVASDAAINFDIAGYHPLWSPDCDALLYLVDSTQSEQEQLDIFSIIDMGTGQGQRLEAPQPVTPLYLSQSGARLVYGTEMLDGPSTTWALDLNWAEGLVTNQTPLENYIPLGWAQQGESLVLAGQGGEALLETDTSNVVPIGSCEAP